MVDEEGITRAIRIGQVWRIPENGIRVIVSLTPDTETDETVFVSMVTPEGIPSEVMELTHFYGLLPQLLADSIDAYGGKATWGL